MTSPFKDANMQKQALKALIYKPGVNSLKRKVFCLQSQKQELHKTMSQEQNDPDNLKLIVHNHQL